MPEVDLEVGDEARGPKPKLEAKRVQNGHSFVVWGCLGMFGLSHLQTILGEEAANRWFHWSFSSEKQVQSSEMS